VTFVIAVNIKLADACLTTIVWHPSECVIGLGTCGQWCLQKIALLTVKPSRSLRWDKIQRFSIFWAHARRRVSDDRNVRFLWQVHVCPNLRKVQFLGVVRPHYHGSDTWLLGDGVVVLDGLVVSVLAVGPKVHGFKFGRGRWIFKDEKIRITPSFGG
jgi:hypothetical protein